MKIERTGRLVAASGRREAKELLVRLRKGGVLCIASAQGRYTLPPQIRAMVEICLAGMAEGQAPLLLTHDQEVSVDEAAAFLRLSRRTVVKMMDEGRLAFRKPGKHRRVQVAALVAFDARLARERDAALDRLSMMSQGFVPTSHADAALGPT